jgi:hypothetical protein
MYTAEQWQHLGLLREAGYMPYRFAGDNKGQILEFISQPYFEEDGKCYIQARIPHEPDSMRKLLVHMQVRPVQCRTYVMCPSSEPVGMATQEGDNYKHVFVKIPEDVFGIANLYIRMEFDKW